MLEVIGFCDAGYKPHGLDAVTYFKPEHVFRVADVKALPKFEVLKKYVGERGYVLGAPKFVLMTKDRHGNAVKVPCGRISTSASRCDPVYKYV